MDGEHVEHIQTYSLESAELWKDGCISQDDISTKFRCKCKCMTAFLHEEHGGNAAWAVAKYINIFFSKKKHQEQQEIFMEWVRSGTDGTGILNKPTNWEF